MNEEVKANIPVVVVGTAPAVKNLGGILTTLKHDLEVKCLPSDLPKQIEVDVSGMETLHSSIHLSDVKVPSGVKLTGNPEEVIVTISVVKEEAVEAPAAEAAPGAEGAAPAEGAAAPAEGAAAPAAEEKK
jgi:large subunit ribosomal protein L25